MDDDVRWRRDDRVVRAKGATRPRESRVVNLYGPVTGDDRRVTLEATLDALQA